PRRRRCPLQSCSSPLLSARKNPTPARTHAPATEPEEMELKLSSPPQHTNQELEQRARWKEERETDRQQPMTAG
ncbi:hypothetical protein BHE74_00050649, partial [Ensete ventricosum]